MTEATLTDLFTKSRGAPVKVDGRVIAPVANIVVRDGTRALITRLTASRSRDQALVLEVDGGTLEVDGYEAGSLALWTSTSPRRVDVVVRGDVQSLAIWNAWRGPVFEGSWLGNAGIVEQPVEGGVTLQCSDGIGEADFTNLVVSIELINP